MTAQRPLLAFFGHHKCATTWINGIMRAVCHELRLSCATIYGPRKIGNDLRAHLTAHPHDVVLYTNANYEQVRRLDGYRGFHVVRDPRDVVVSAYYAHRNSHRITEEWPELAEQRDALQAMPKEEGLLYMIEKSELIFSHMAGWNYDDPDVLQLTMEDLTKHPYERFVDVFDFLGLLDTSPLTSKKRLRYLLARQGRAFETRTKRRIPLAPPERLPAERLLGILWEQRFSAKAGGRTAGQEDASSHYRKGEAGDWRNHFKPEHVAYFKERYNPLLLKLGYEQTPDWT